MSFVYDGVPLLAMLDEYAMLRQDREEEKLRMRVRVPVLSLQYLSCHYLCSPSDDLIIFILPGQEKVSRADNNRTRSLWFKA